MKDYVEESQTRERTLSSDYPIQNRWVGQTTRAKMSGERTYARNFRYSLKYPWNQIDTGFQLTSHKVNIDPWNLDGDHSKMRKVVLDYFMFH